MTIRLAKDGQDLRLLHFSQDIEFLYKEGVFDLKGNLDLEKIVLFKDKYDEKISEKTVIPR